MDNISIHIKNFNDKVKVMNQTQSRDITLNAQEARNLHSEIFALLAHIAELSNKLQVTPEDTIEITMDGGGFK
jgi:hypothetical protein